MPPWQLLDSALITGSKNELRLYRREQEFSIRVNDEELMNSRVYSSEDRFSELGCERIRGRDGPRVLIGGLGMGYSLRAALDNLPAAAEVILAELVPQVVTWNRDQLGHLAGHPLDDPRVQLREIDVARVLREARAAYDLILLDVDNGPEGLTRKANDWLYARAGLEAARRALRPDGVLGFWASGPDQSFVQRLEQVGFAVETAAVRAADGCYGVLHTVWFAVVHDGARAVGDEPDPAETDESGPSAWHRN